MTEAAKKTKQKPNQQAREKAWSWVDVYKNPEGNRKKTTDKEE